MKRGHQSGVYSSATVRKESRACSIGVFLTEIDEKIALLSGGISSYGLHPRRGTKSRNTVGCGIGRPCARLRLRGPLSKVLKVRSVTKVLPRTNEADSARRISGLEGRSEKSAVARDYHSVSDHTVCLNDTSVNTSSDEAGGGLALLVAMPLAGIATGRFPARNLAAIGFACFTGAFYYTSTRFTLSMTFGFASWLRILQMIPIPFCFIAITNAAYVGLPKEASNQVSGIINFVRNVGGSIFIAVTGAIVTNRSLFHQAHLQENMLPENPAFVSAVNRLTAYFGGSGRGPGARLMARGNRHGLSGHLPSALLDGNGQRCTSNLRRRLSRPRRQYAAL
jgi:hypothetical protein